ncbi:MAG: hypothetical protein CMC08_02910 [Flavobacteriaceae bacterium]|nr:hypothetical protein [Flavobacteriaceae bacterium]|tara:strand:+ start:249 stop:473 length:225 start_codon:yes stop_codon:yes gene_type:complete
MKLSAMTLVGVSTLLLVTVVVFATMNLAFSWVFYLTVIGQAIFGYTVYKVLTDEYSTDKTFDDFYEDRPISREE